LPGAIDALATAEMMSSAGHRRFSAMSFVPYANIAALASCNFALDSPRS
jgi:hypothetical protein